MSRIEVENINHPGRTRKVDGKIYELVRAAYLSVLPDTVPGLTIREAEAGVAAIVPMELFANGAQVGWWSKTAQLDLEAKGLIVRSDERPLRLHRTEGTTAG